MSNNKQQPDSPVGRLIVTFGIGYVLWLYPVDSLHDPMLVAAWWFGALCVAIGLAKSIPVLGGGFGRLFSVFRAFRPDTSKGSAGFMTEREARRLRLHRRKQGARFIGTMGRTALWLWTETHHLIVGPSGSAKSTSAIMNILMAASESALINDIKGELHATTAIHRAKAFGHKVLKIDVNDPSGSIAFNPMDDVVVDIAANNPRALSRVKGIALQLLPDPQGGGGANAVFYQGGRTVLSTVQLAVCVVMPKEQQTLTMVNRAINDMDILHDLLDAASKSKALNGEIGDAARSLHQMAFGDDGNAKTFESFRTNASLAVDAYGPGGYLAPLTSATTFHFRDLKSEKVSLYIMIDYANAEVLGSFSGLIQHLAADAMVEVGDSTPVLFCLDEFTNAVCRKLASILTLLRSAGVRVVMATQDLNDIERVYSKHDLETVLSEAHIKQFLAVRSKTTLNWLASYLGEYTEVVSSWSMGRDEPQESLSRASRKVLTEDEVRRLPDDAQIVIYGNKKPILAKKVQVFAVAPWRHQLGINRAYSNKRKLLPVDVRLRWWGTDVTRRAARAYRRIMRELFQTRQPSGRLLAQLLRNLRFGPVLVAAAMVGMVLMGTGLPNLRWSYTYAGSAQQTPVAYIRCRYLGPTSPGVIRGPNCPLILWRKH